MAGAIERTWGVMLKEFRQISRDTRSLGLILFVPAFMLTLFGYAITFDVKHVKIVVLDHDRTQASYELVSSLFHNEYFDLAGTIDKESEADRWLDEGAARAVIVIPNDFGKSIREEKTVPVQVLVDGGNANSANVTIGYLEGMFRRYNADRAHEAALRLGITTPLVPIDVEPRVWYNPDMKSSQFLVPGLMAYLLMLVGTISTALSVVREKERGTMEQIVVSPVTSSEFIIGKALPYLIVCIVTGALIVVAAVVLFGLPLRGSIPWLFVTTVIYLFGALALGLFISTIADTQQVALQISVMATMLPAMLLSGMIFPISSMPKVLQWLTWAVPPRHEVDILRSIILKGTGIGGWWLQFTILCVFAVLMLVVSIRRMRKNQGAA